MKESFFKFSDPYIVSLNYTENSNFDPKKFEEIKVDFSNQIGKDIQNNKALVSVNMNIGDCDSCPFKLSILMRAVFYWDGCTDEELIKVLLEKNAVSLLIGYIRPIVANITSSSKFPTFNLPFLNLEDEE